MSARIRTNITGLYVLFAKTGASVVGLCLVISVLFMQFIALGTRVEHYILLALWVLLPLMWAGWALALRAKWDKTSYALTDDAIVLSTKQLGGGGRKQLYRYDAILSVSASSGLWGGRYNYGDIALDIPRLDRQVMLRHVANPEDVAEQIKSHVAHHGTKRASAGI